MTGIRRARDSGKAEASSDATAVLRTWLFFDGKRRIVIYYHDNRQGPRRSIPYLRQCRAAYTKTVSRYDHGSSRNKPQEATPLVLLNYNSYGTLSTGYNRYRKLTYCDESKRQSGVEFKEAEEVCLEDFNCARGCIASTSCISNTELRLTSHFPQFKFVSTSDMNVPSFHISLQTTRLPVIGKLPMPVHCSRAIILIFSWSRWCKVVPEIPPSLALRSGRSGLNRLQQKCLV